MPGMFAMTMAFGFMNTAMTVVIDAVDQHTGREAGVLLGRTGTGDPIDATIVLLAETGDRVLTSDSGDITALAAAAHRTVRLVTC